MPNILTEELLNNFGQDKSNIESVIRKIINSNDDDDEEVVNSSDNPDFNEKILFEVENYENYTNSFLKLKEEAKNETQYEKILSKVLKFAEEMCDVCYFKKISVTDALEQFQSNSLLGKMNESQVFFSLQGIFDIAKSTYGLRIENNVI